MLWLEMSRDFEHGGGSWGFAQSLWSPTRKLTQSGRSGGRWPFWENILRVRKGDVVLHLREEQHAAFFVGFSTAETDGEMTAERPPLPGQWGYDHHFYRALVNNFQPFSSALALQNVFTGQELSLRHYYEENRHRPSGEKRLLFYTIQAGRLQRLNGAYLSEVDEALEAILLPQDPFPQALGSRADKAAVVTGEQIAQLWVRVGQQAFSEKVRANYHMHCCFPDCPIAEARFLIGSHIARWADAPGLRGHLGNGVCLCLLHDKAFEIGLFTIDRHLRIQINWKHPEVTTSHWCATALLPYEGRPMRSGDILPLEEALEQHWRRISLQVPDEPMP